MTGKNIFFFAGTLLFIGCMFPGPVFSKTFIVKNGQSKADIVIADNPARAVKLAALELQIYIEKISGARLPVVTAPGTNVSAHIYVGRSAHTDQLNITDEGLKYGAFRMVSGRDYLVLLGHDKDFSLPEYAPRNYPDFQRALKKWDERTGEKWGNPLRSAYRRYSPALGMWDFDLRGSLNAVYEFLRVLGVRWYMPGDLGEIVPVKKTIMLPQVDKVVRPDFPYRNLGDYSPHFDGGTRDAILYRFRIGLDPVMGIPGPHGLNGVKGRDEVKKAHPEYFALYGGKRATEGKYFASCLSSEGLFESTVKYARAVFDIYPDETMISIMPNDGYYMLCQCDLCKGKGALDPRGPGYGNILSDYVWDFTDRVARELYKTHPDKKVFNMAYGAYTLPPEKIAKFSPNVMVGIVQPRPDFHNPETLARMMQIRKGYLEKLAPGNLLTTTHYLFSRPEYGRNGIPIYFPHVIAGDLRSLKGISQGEITELAWGGDDFHVPGFNHLNVYVTARFYWDADQDVDKMLDEYYKLFYGPAAGEMKAFIEYSEANWPLMTRQAGPADKALVLLSAARKAAGDTVYGKRVDLLVNCFKPLCQLRDRLANSREKGLPRARIVDCNRADIKIDGKLDDPFWKPLPVYSLSELQTGRGAFPGTSFQIGWEGQFIYFGIRCSDRDMKNLNITTTTNDDARLLDGDFIDILLETQGHSYYEIAVNPAGALFDADMKDGCNPAWSSGAEVAVHSDDKSWSVEARIPTGDAIDGGVDPMKSVEGRKPNVTYPWYFNVCRQRVKSQETARSAFSPTGTNSFHVPLKFGELTDRW